MPFLNKIVRKFAKQKAVLWKRIDTDPDGRGLYDPPVEIFCRVESRQQQLVTSDGRTVRVASYLMTSTPVAVGDLVRDGTLAEWQALPSYPDLPTSLEGGQEVQIAGGTPDLKASEFLYEAYF